MSFDLSGYVDVAERIRIFREKYPNGSLQPLDHAKPFDVITVGERMFVVYVAAAYRDANDQRPGVGVAWESFPGTTPYTRDSELMNAETSAWGRAIIATLAADTQKIASADEVRNRQTERHPSAPPLATSRKPDKVAPAGENVIPIAKRQPQEKPSAQSVGITEAQTKLIGKLAREKNYDALTFASNAVGRQVDDLNGLTKREASAVITDLMNAETVV